MPIGRQHPSEKCASPRPPPRPPPPSPHRRVPQGWGAIRRAPAASHRPLLLPASRRRRRLCGSASGSVVWARCRTRLPPMRRRRRGGGTCDGCHATLRAPWTARWPRRVACGSRTRWALRRYSPSRLRLADAGTDSDRGARCHPRRGGLTQLGGGGRRPNEQTLAEQPWPRHHLQRYPLARATREPLQTARRLRQPQRRRRHLRQLRRRLLTRVRGGPARAISAPPSAASAYPSSCASRGRSPPPRAARPQRPVSPAASPLPSDLATCWAPL